MALSILGYQPKDLFLRAAKTLMAGACGVAVGFVTTDLLVSQGVPYGAAAWPGYALGFLVNFAVQVKAKNIIVKRV